MTIKSKESKSGIGPAHTSILLYTGHDTAHSSLIDGIALAVHTCIYAISKPDDLLTGPNKVSKQPLLGNMRMDNDLFHRLLTLQVI